MQVALCGLITGKSVDEKTEIFAGLNILFWADDSSISCFITADYGHELTNPRCLLAIRT